MRVSISSSKKQIFIVIAAQEALTKCQAWFICNFTGLRYYLKQTCKMGFIQVLKMMFKKLKSTPINSEKDKDDNQGRLQLHIPKHYAILSAFYRKHYFL